MSSNLKNEITYLVAFYLMIGYFFICAIFPTLINTLVRKQITDDISVWLNIATLIITNTGFFICVGVKMQYRIVFLKNITLVNILLAIGCSILFFLLLDKFLDPIFDKVFPKSAVEYQETLTALRQFPATTFIRVCLFAPITEEILIRGYLLTGLQNKYGVLAALTVTTVLFALLHFNFVQTLSAVICGLVIGLLFIHTDSLFCCILAHILYNSISYFTEITLRS
jgi:membrane protease YdiL (CAAX protease family)